MDVRSVLITGGAGFVGSSLAVLLKAHIADVTVTAFDNLMRRGGELNLARLKAAGVDFVHGDVRCRDDFEGLKPFDLLIDCSAEPSVQAGTEGAPRKVLDINLRGTINCLEAARANGAAVLLLSTSRVYPIEALRSVGYVEGATRFELADDQPLPGFSTEGVSERFSLEGARSFYGTSKLASEHILQEYVYNYGLRGLIDRCGVLAGPHQMARTDQGVVTLWLARHIYGRPLRYIGFGGSGKQVRDLLHVHDLFDLIMRQLGQDDCWDGTVFNVGGGRPVSVSLLELTDLCRGLTGNTVDITPQPETHAVDIPVYLTDARLARDVFDWTPSRDIESVLGDILKWITDNQAALKPILAEA